jgi:hypothetical protein
MATRKIYRVQHLEGSWHVRHDGSTLSRHALKDDAVAEGQKVAKANEPSQLVVHRLDGTFEYEYTYGSDPFPPAG